MSPPQKKADELGALLKKHGGAHPQREPQLRARLGLRKLANAGLVLQSRDEDTPPSEPPAVAGSQWRVRRRPSGEP